MIFLGINVQGVAGPPLMEWLSRYEAAGRYGQVRRYQCAVYQVECARGEVACSTYKVECARGGVACATYKMECVQAEVACAVYNTESELGGV